MLDNNDRKTRQKTANRRMLFILAAIAIAFYFGIMVAMVFR